MFRQYVQSILIFGDHATYWVSSIEKMKQQGGHRHLDISKEGHTIGGCVEDDSLPAKLGECQSRKNNNLYDFGDEAHRGKA